MALPNNVATLRKGWMCLLGHQITSSVDIYIFYFTGAEGEGVQVKFFQNPGYTATDLHTGILSTFYLTLT